MDSVDFGVDFCFATHSTSPPGDAKAITSISKAITSILNIVLNTCGNKLAQKNTTVKITIVIGLKVVARGLKNGGKNRQISATCQTPEALLK
jgi:hypothetical protein